MSWMDAMFSQMVVFIRLLHFKHFEHLCRFLMKSEGEDRCLLLCANPWLESQAFEC